MSKLTMTIRSEDDYYDLIEASGTQVLVFGEMGEMWTIEVLKLLEEDEVPVNFFPWQEIVELRLQLELVHYPVLQVYHSGSLQYELKGYHCEGLKNILEHI